MSTYLDVANLKAYLRITDTLDDALLGQVCDAVEAEQRARCVPSTFSLDALRASSVDTDDPNMVVLTCWGFGDGPFEWDFGDGTEVDTAPGITTTWHRYADAGTYDVVLRDNADATLCTLTGMVVPLTDTYSTPGTAVHVPPDVYQAALMRGSRLYARRASPEGLVGLGEMGVARIPAYDRDIDALESPWRTVVLA